MFSFSLNKQSDSSYAGINFRKNTPLDLSSFDRVKIRLKSSDSTSLKIILYAFVPEITEQDKPMSYAYLMKEIPASTETETYELKLSEFQIPDWWYECNHLKLYDKTIRCDLSTINRITIENGNMPDKINSDTIIIEEITFIGSQKSLLITSGLIMLFSVSALTVFRTRLFPNAKITKKKTIPRHINISLSENSLNDSEIIEDYLCNHFSETDISINKTSAQTGIAAFKISKIMKEKFEKTFPQYITEIRLDEAKRLLVESDIKIIEIAFLVGFGNISHFNKVFAKQEKISPKEFRRIHRNKSKYEHPADQ